MSKKDTILIRGARQNNLRNISIDIPKHKLVVITGVSGSGKSSLAFDTVYAEGYRRYVENLSSSARFFLHSIKKPKVERIENLSPSIAIDQKSDSSNPRSTVGTVTDVYDFLRMLYANVGIPYCPECEIKLEKQDEEKLINHLRKMRKGTRVVVLADWKGAQEGYRAKLNAIAGQGYSKVRVEKKMYSIDEAKQKKTGANTAIQVVVDKLMLLPKKFDRERIVDSLQVAAKIAKGRATILIDNEKELHYSKHFRCPKCFFTLREISPKNFSFNSPEGACSICSGLGVVFQADLNKIIPSQKISINEGAIMPWSRSGGRINGDSLHFKILKELAKKYKFSLNKPVNKIPKEILEKIIFGEEEPILIEVNNKERNKKEVEFRGVAHELEEKYKNAESSFIRNEIEKYLTKKTCPDCEGKRLKKEYLNFQVLEKTIDEIVGREIEKLANDLKNELGKLKNKPSGKKAFFGQKKTDKEKIIINVMEEILSRLTPLNDVGLGYLSLDRSTQTLSGGEYQRVRLSTQLYSGLSDVIYVLDEPSIGLHPRDTKRLIKTLVSLKQSGNSILVVEHDRDIIKAADHVIDIGPKAGKEGGKVVFEGSIAKLKKAKTETAGYLYRRKQIKGRRQTKPSKDSLTIKGATENNLKNIDVEIPLGRLISIVGVSGSGKSSLVNNILAKELRRKLHRSSDDSGKHKKIEGAKHLSKIVIVNQAPIGRSPRSNAATYTGLFSHIRKLFAQTDLAEKKRLTASHFSFNMRGGRCEYCQGEGVKRIEMHLLSNIYADCPYCNGTRYSKKMLEVEYHGANIVDVLNMSVDYAYHFFNSHHLIKDKLGALKKVGLGYLRLGQNATELSGGETQRIKLATELSRKSNGNTLYILDEPTIGLHFSDVKKLLLVLRGLVDSGNSVVLVEHNADLIEASDWVIELGPEGGEAGGRIVFEGTPKKIRKAKTWTGKTL